MIGEHDSEPVPGLPGQLPGGERMLWQGSPSWWALAKSAFHVRAVALYFVVLTAWRVASVHAGGAMLSDVLTAALLPLGLGVAAAGLLTAIAWLMARTTLYTLTTRRVIFRIGVAFPMTVNLPFTVVEAASLKRGRDGVGDIALETETGQRVSYLILWPHVRPWRFARPQATLRAVPDAAVVARRVSAALAAFAGQPLRASPGTPAPVPGHDRERGARSPLAAAS